MADKWPLANGNWSNAANWNGGTKPVAGDDVYADGRTLNVDESFTVATLRTTQRTGGTVGGSFNFNTAGVTGTLTSASPIIFGAANAIAITATTGTVTIDCTSITSAISPLNVQSTTYINYSGACNLVFNLSQLNGAQFSSNVGSIVTLSKTSFGTLTFTGLVQGGGAASGGGGGGNHAISCNAGSIIVNGNVRGATISTNGGGTTSAGINQTAGTLTVNGDVIGGTTTSASQNGVVFAGTSLTINGNIIAGSSTSIPLITSGVSNTITGNVTAGTVAAISSTTANIINVTGTVTASATSQAISMTNANGQVYLNGNMVNNNGKMAIYAPIVWLDRTGTTTASFFTSGGVARTLYSEDTFPNMPAEADTRNNIVYGPGSGLTGTLKMPAAADTRNGVVYDNGTTGTALFTTATLLSEMGSSTTPVAVRMRNCATPEILGEILEAFKK